MDQKLLYLSRRDVAAVDLSMAEIISAVEDGFFEMGRGRVEMPPKPGIHPGTGGNSFIHAMPAYVPAAASAGIKWVSGFPTNLEKGLPYITGLLILNDPETGLPTAVMDCTWITGMRTGAASAVSAKHLARTESRVIGILGCGIQGHTHLEAMAVLFPLERLIAYDVDPAQSRRLTDAARERFGMDATITDDPRTAVFGCDIVVTAGPILKVPHATIQADWIQPGTFFSCVDFDTYFSREALHRADKWTTDHLDQYTHYRDVMGFFQDCPPVHAELGELVTGEKPGRTSADEITFAANLGVAMEDMVVAPRIVEKAAAMGIGTWLAL